ncbi:MAG: TIGR00282 family metallophosphoesterase [Planctomycetota bacterium]|nr:TIGR00282 family metallophosphoesterase [Planctomycetota bacterium]
MDFRILAIGDIVGRPGRDALKRRLKDLKAEESVDFCVANGENTAAGSGITPDITEELLAAGVDVITTGDHVFRKKDIVPAMDRYQRLLRPANYSAGAAGHGMCVVESARGVKVAVINVQGRIFMDPALCPFEFAEKLAREAAPQTCVIVVDAHCEATSEKIALGWFLDGRVSMVFGTHTHIQTADERVLPKGTAYITDLGMTGPYDSVLGRRIDRVLYSFTTQMPSHFEVATDDVRISGAIATIDTATGRASAIKRVHVAVPP